MKKNNLPLIKFNTRLPRLSGSEKKVLKLLVEAGELIAPIYLKQEEQAKEFNKEEIEKAAKTDSSILSPYTVIEKVNNKLITIPYHIKYEKFLKPIAEKLDQAARLTENKEFSNALKVQAKTILNGTYEQSMITWLKTKPYILDISIGPINHYDNQLFSGKASYQAWVGVLDIEGTNRFNNYKDITLSARRKALMPKERLESSGKVKAKVIDAILFSGLMAKTKFSGVNLPMDVDLVEKHGSEITLFNQTNELRLKEQILPAFNKIFSKAFRRGFTREDLTRGYQRSVALHELAHSYLYYKHAANNLQDLFQCIYELSATILGLRMAGSLLLKDRITEKQLESMIVAYLCRNFYLIEHSKINKSLVNYTLGGAIFINFMFESGALKQKEGLIILNFMKIFVSLHDLSYMLENLLAHGSRKEAKGFIKKYGNLNIYQPSLYN